VQSNYKLDAYDFGPSPSPTGFLGRAMQDMIVSILERVSAMAVEVQLR
jgi:hypothetical protein